MKKLTLSLFVACLLLLQPMLKAQSANSRLTSEPLVGNANDKPFQFAAIILKISKKENIYNVSIVQSRVIRAAYKKSLEPIPSSKEGDLICYMMNQKGMAIDSLTIGNPLREHIESFGEDGTISNAFIDKIENEIMIRFNYTGEMQFMLIKKIENDGRVTTIAKLNILAAN